MDEKAAKAEIIAIGSELLTPDRVDTNSLYLTQKLNEAGFEVHLKTVVGDRVADIENLLRLALRRSRLILLCGGLGPTEDDVTRVATAKALGRGIGQSEEILKSLRDRFALRGIRMAHINQRQAEIVEGAEILPNAVGTAPGMWIEDHDTVVVLLPGPPRELKAMFEAHIAPRAARLAGKTCLKIRAIGIQGLPESEVDTRIAPIYRSYPEVQTTILAIRGTISLRLQQWVPAGVSPHALNDLVRRICAELGEVVYTAAGESLEEVIGRLLRGSGCTVAVAESCTAGLIGSALTRVPGSSEYFRGGILCYSNDLKADLGGVPRHLLEQHGAVSAQVAEALAAGVRRIAESSIGLAVTGIAGPGGGSEQKPVGLVYVGLADETRRIHTRRIFPGDRETVRELATTVALGCLRRFLMFPEEKE